MYGAQHLPLSEPLPAPRSPSSRPPLKVGALSPLRQAMDLRPLLEQSTARAGGGRARPAAGRQGMWRCVEASPNSHLSRPHQINPMGDVSPEPVAGLSSCASSFGGQTSSGAGGSIKLERAQGRGEPSSGACAKQRSALHTYIRRRVQLCRLHALLKHLPPHWPLAAPTRPLVRIGTSISIPETRVA